MNRHDGGPSNAPMQRWLTAAHGVITAATVAGTLAIHGLGAWLWAALGRRPRACVDDLAHWSFQVASWTTGLLMAVAYFGVVVWVPLTIVQACTAGRGTWTRQALGLRVALVVLAWASLVADPLGGWAWFLD